jgi:hypothetical protein
MASLSEYWLKHYSNGHGCILCLNTGILKSAVPEMILVHGKREAAYPVVPCFCPNGRAMRRAHGRARKFYPHHTAPYVTTTKEKAELRGLMDTVRKGLNKAKL